MAQWRFDQGRLEYFQVDEIRNIAGALAELDGTRKPVKDDKDHVRKVLLEYTALPFAPSSYYVWRNYGRVFECQLLATEISGVICATDLCKKIAAQPDDFDSDDYLAHFSRNFYYSSPIFVDYAAGPPQVFPAVAIIKYLISEFLTKGKYKITVDEIVQRLMYNNVTGTESLNKYTALPKKPIPPNSDLRQIRELVIFISQFSFLKWDAPNLYLEVTDPDELYAIENSLKPVQNVRNPDNGLEILQMGSLATSQTMGGLTLSKVVSLDEDFTEGQKIRVTHLRSERSAKLKSLYFAHIPAPHKCRMCSMDTVARYPWTDHVIELHHLLPLCSPVRVEKGTTSVKDIVGLCPSCHRATHKYYSYWFKKNTLKDFRSYAEAAGVYNEAKSKIVN